MSLEGWCNFGYPKFSLIFCSLGQTFPDLPLHVRSQLNLHWDFVLDHPQSLGGYSKDNFGVIEFISDFRLYLILPHSFVDRGFRVNCACNVAMGQINFTIRIFIIHLLISGTQGVFRCRPKFFFGPQSHRFIELCTCPCAHL